MIVSRPLKPEFVRTDLFVILGVEPLNKTIAKSAVGVLKKTCHRPEVTRTKNPACVEEDAVFLLCGSYASWW